MKKLEDNIKKYIDKVDRICSLVIQLLYIVTLIIIWIIFEEAAKPFIILCMVFFVITLTISAFSHYKIWSKVNDLFFEDYLINFKKDIDGE